jgi:hypothetical protein
MKYKIIKQLPESFIQSDRKEDKIFYKINDILIWNEWLNGYTRIDNTYQQRVFSKEIIENNKDYFQEIKE